MENRTDHDLALAAARGESDALEALVERHYGMLYRVAYRYVGTREEAEDVAQDACVKLARAIGRFRGDAAFSTWVYRIAVNAAHDHLRKRAMRAATEGAYTAEQALWASGGSGNPVDTETLYRAVGALAPKLRDAVMLVLAEGMTHAEAARVLGIAETTVSWRIFQARGKLRKALLKEVG